ncbi:hypothetical protein [Megasphaera cerevisiae]|uniref:hypothetical protein n=1 Tax=Megasphaera cerevisiae TaxID=39029 RepID=UPI000ADE94FD|nr:hypothetical protein [Megasphaera cerevisiae]
MGLWSEAGAINGALTEDAVSSILPFVGGGFISPAICTGKHDQDGRFWDCGVKRAP